VRDRASQTVPLAKLPNPLVSSHSRVSKLSLMPPRPFSQNRYDYDIVATVRK